MSTNGGKRLLLGYNNEDFESLFLQGALDFDVIGQIDNFTFETNSSGQLILREGATTIATFDTTAVTIENLMITSLLLGGNLDMAGFVINNLGDGGLSGSGGGVKFFAGTRMILDGDTDLQLRTGGVQRMLIENTQTHVSSGNFLVDTDTFFVDATNDRVGINTNTPSSPLHIVSTVQTGLILDRPGGGAIDIEFHNPGTSENAKMGVDTTGDMFFTVVDAQDEIHFHTLNLRRMTIDDAGFIGIGTDTPDAPLHIVTTEQTALILDRPGGQAVTIEFRNPGTSDNARMGVDTTGDMIFIVVDVGDEIHFFTQNLRRMTIDDAGLIGIGTDTPSVPLDVVGDINTTTDYNIGGIQVLSSTTLGGNIVNSNLQNLGTLTTLTMSGDIAMGSNSITGISNAGMVSGLTGGSYEFADNSLNLKGTNTVQIRTSGFQRFLVSDTVTDVVSGDFCVDTQTFLVDTTNKRIGINTNAPAFPLQVKGDVNTIFDIFSDGTTTTNMTIRNDAATITLGLDANDDCVLSIGDSMDLIFTTAAEVMRITSSGLMTLSGNILMGSNDVDWVGGCIGPVGGNTLDLNGDSFVQFKTSDVARILISDTQTHVTSGNFIVDTDTLFVDAGNNRVGINTITPSEALHVHGGDILIHSNGDLDVGLRIFQSGQDVYASVDVEDVGSTGELIFNMGVNFNNGGGVRDVTYEGAWFRIDTRASDNRFSWIWEEPEPSSPVEIMSLTKAGNLGVLGSLTMGGNIAMGGNIITGVGNDGMDGTGGSVSFFNTNTVRLNGDDNLELRTSLTQRVLVTDTKTEVTSGDFAVSTNVLFVDQSTARVGIKTSTPAVELDVIGVVNVSDDIKLTTADKSITNQNDVPIAGEIPYAHYRREAAQSVSTNSITTIDWDTEVTDRGGFSESGGTITVPTEGLYMITWNITWDVNSTGERISYLDYGTKIFGYTNNWGGRSAPTNIGGSNGSTILNMPSSLTFIIRVIQNSGGNLSTQVSTTFENNLTIARIGNSV